MYPTDQVTLYSDPTGQEPQKGTAASDLEEDMKSVVANGLSPAPHNKCMRGCQNRKVSPMRGKAPLSNSKRQREGCSLTASTATQTKQIMFENFILFYIIYFAILNNSAREILDRSITLF